MSNTTAGNLTVDDSCFNEYSVLRGIPYLLFPNRPTTPPNPITGLRDDNIQLWIYVGLVVFCLGLAILNFIVQFIVAIPYGKHDKGDGSLRVPLRLSFAISQILTGFIVFSVTYFLQRHYNRPINIVLYCLFTIHYINRAVVDTFAARHSQTKVTVWIPLLATLSTMFYHYINAQFIGEARFCRGYYFDPRFIVGLIIFLTGFILNRVADAQLIVLRTDYKDRNYQIPMGCSFFLISCPNYLGELIEWFGWIIMTWSLSAIVWFLFVAGTFIPRARHHHIWYQGYFDDYPSRRKRLVPFIY